MSLEPQSGLERGCVEIVRCADGEHRVQLRIDDEVLISDQTFATREDALDAMIQWYHRLGVRVLLLQ